MILSNKRITNVLIRLMRRLVWAFFVCKPLQGPIKSWCWCGKVFSESKTYLGCGVRKPVYMVSEQVMLKSTCSATTTSLSIRILHGSSLTNIVFR